MGAQASFSTITLGLPAMAPALREAYDLDLKGVGLFLAAEWVGLTIALLPWGLVTDRIGERRALASGLSVCGALVCLIGLANSALAAGALLALAAGAGASVQSASGRAVMQWFGPSERGLAFGVRQTAVPLGGVIGALVLPALANAHGVEASFLFLGLFCVATAVIGYAVVRDLPSEGVDVEEVESTLRDRRLWVLCGGSGLYVTAQMVLFSFLVLYLHDERGFSAAGAAGVLATAQVVAVFLRVGVGRWSDVLRSRIVPLRRIGIATTAALAAAAILLDAPNAVVVSLLVVATALSAAWNGLSFVAAAELAGAARSGAAIGFQQTVLSVAGIVVPPLFASVVDASSWRLGFGVAAVAPLLGWVLLGRLSE
ncbi:MAG TPA: MFS transporter [Gaiellaceae bacterium]|nr:MFS transporter [Gaiellaceae bacterium]